MTTHSHDLVPSTFDLQSFALKSEPRNPPLRAPLSPYDKSALGLASDGVFIRTWDFDKHGGIEDYPGAEIVRVSTSERRRFDSPLSSPLSSAVSSEGDYLSVSRAISRSTSASTSRSASRPRTRKRPSTATTATESMPPFTKKVKERRSLQSIFVPSFLHTTVTALPAEETTSSSAVGTSHSPQVKEFETRRRAQTHSDGSSTQPDGRVSPSAYLLDEDPFANLSSPASPTLHVPAFQSLPVTPSASLSSFTSPHAEHSTQPPPPPSPLNPNHRPLPPPSLSAPTPGHRPSLSSSQHHSTRPAHTRPAFTPRPSLPSLSTLARMNVLVPAKKRKGKVGAGLPLEPWGTPQNGSMRSSQSSSDTLDLAEPGPSSERDTILGLSQETPFGYSGARISVGTTGNNENGELLNQDISYFASAHSEPIPDSSTHAFNDTEVATLSYMEQPEDESHIDTSRDSQLSAQRSSPSPTGPASVDELLINNFAGQSTSPIPPSRPESMTIDPGLSATSDYEPEEDNSMLLPPLSHDDYDYDFALTLMGRLSSHTHKSSLSDSFGTRSPSFEGIVDLDAGLVRRSSESDSESSLGEELSSYGSSSLLDTDSGRLAPRSSFNPLSDWDADGDLEEDFDAMIGWKPMDAKDLDFEPGSSAGTLRPLFHGRHRSASDGDGAESWTVGPTKEFDFAQSVEKRVKSCAGGHTPGRGPAGAGVGWGGGGGYRATRGGREDRESSERANHPEQPPGDGHNRRDGSDDDKGEYRGTRSTSSTPSSSEQSSDSEISPQSPALLHSMALESAPHSQRRNGMKGVYRPPSESRRAGPGGESSEDDEVPLAQRIPGALIAQKSIRKKVREERQRTRENSAAYSPASQEPPRVSTERGRKTSLKLPRGAAMGNGTGMSSSREAASLAQKQPLRNSGGRRERAMTMSGSKGVAPDDLALRLMKVQAQSPAASGSSSFSPSFSPRQTAPPPREGELVYADDFARRAARARSVERRRPTTADSSTAPVPHRQPPLSVMEYQQQVAAASKPRELRPMRSFQAPSRTLTVTAALASPLPAQSQPLGRSSTTHAEPRRSEDDPRSSGTVGRSKSVKGARRSGEGARSPANPTFSGRASLDTDSPSHKRATSRPPVPRLPDPEGLQAMPRAPPSWPAASTTSTRVFIGDLQRYKMVDIGSETNAQDVLDEVARQGELWGEENRPGGWMLYEVSQDFGMERPIRSYELLSDVSASWNKDKGINMFMIKKTPLERPLSIMPSSSPMYGGYVEWEKQKGKWSKRWLELREHSLWISKREGKAEDCLCSLSAFDAYFVTRIHKSPKPFVFAVKSTDSISLFENTADYMHVFSCSEEDGRKWMERIHLARSYIMYQEKHVLFRNKSSAPPSAGIGATSALSRSGTRKPAPPRLPIQPFVTVPPPFGTPAAAAQGPFEPGSLLAKRT